MQKEKKKNLIKMLMGALFIAGFFAISARVQAATGDVLFGCTFDGAGSTPSQVVSNCGGSSDSGINTNAAIVTNGHDGNKSIRYYHPGGEGEIVSLFSTSQLNKQEVTVDYWEKYDVAESASGIWNCKSIRQYVYPGNGDDYFAAMISRHDGAAWYQSTWGSANLSISSAVSDLSNSGDYDCTWNGTSYTCHTRLQILLTQQWGTTWHHIRVYVKVPSNSSSSDGETTVWMDGTMIYHLFNASSSSNWSSDWAPMTSYITFHPSDAYYTGYPSESKPAFHHSYDDITVYEGYVPPGSADATAPANPSGLSVS